MDPDSGGDRSDAGIHVTGAVCALSAEPEQRIRVPFNVTDQDNQGNELFYVFI